MRLLEEALGVSGETIETEIFRSGFEDSADLGEMDAEAYLKGISERLGVEVGARVWLDARKGSMFPNDDVLDLARRVGERVPTALFTNNGHLTADAFAELFPAAAALFGDRCFFSARLGASKETPEGFGAILSRLDWRAEETLLVDDKETYCEAAREAGLETHLFASAEQLARDLEARGLL